MEAIPSSDGEGHGVALLQMSGGQRPAARARHVLVDAAVQHMIEGGGGTGSQGDAEGAENQGRQAAPSRATPAPCRRWP